MCTLDYWFTPYIIGHAVEKVNIVSAPRTDHLAVSMSICNDKITKGSGYWKFNNSWLENNHYTCALINLIDECKHEYKQFLSPKLFWDLCKTKIRSFTIDYAKDSQKERSSELKNVEIELELLYEKCIEYPNDNTYKSKYHMCKIKYELMYSHYMKGLQIRSKERWIEHGEKCSKYFLNLEKNRMSKKSICTLKCKDGKVTSDQSVILREQVDYFSELYKSKFNVTNDEFDVFFQDTVIPTLNDEESDSCEGILNIDECFDALSAMACNKSPGYDGLTAEFYRHFWSKIGQLVVDALNNGFSSGSFTSSQNRGIISLIHKGKSLPRDRLNNYRPIALLNIDYKIATKALAARVQNILPTLVNTDQNGFVKGRNIQDNIRLIEDVLRYVDDHNIPGIMLCIDFKKAFDSIERDYILYALKKLNFGPMFCKWISVILNNSTNCMINNGNISGPFNVDCGVRQGCPIASLIFVLSSELLCCKIRQSKQMQGIRLPFDNYGRNDLRISSFADDTTIFVKSPECVKVVMSILDSFTNLSGLAINMCKSDAVWIGSLKNNTYGTDDVNWKLAPNNNIKILGVTFSPSIPIEKNDCNWTDKMSSVERCIRAWKMRGLSMIGRNIIVKTLLASKFSYIASVINMPDDVLNKLNKMFVSFIWGRAEAVKRNTVIADFDKGGINMFNIKLYFDSLKISWVKKLHNTTVACWKNIPLYYMNTLGIGVNIFNCNCNFKQIHSQYPNLRNKLPVFYYMLLKIWFGTKQVLTEHDMQTCYTQVIWINDVIQLNKKTILYPDWVKAGFIYIRDILDGKGQLHSLEYFQSRINNGAVLLKYYALLKALPNKWRNAHTYYMYNVDIDTIDISFNTIPIDVCSTKIFRRAMIDKIYLQPRCIQFWDQRFPHYVFDWQNIWLATPRCTNEARLVTLNWKILHNIYPTKVLLHKMGKETDNICNSCNTTDYIDHFFFKCVKSKPLWSQANKIISIKLSINICLTVNDVMFNYHNNAFEDVNIKYINHVIAVGKLCISKFRYGKHPNLFILFERELRLRKLL